MRMRGLLLLIMTKTASSTSPQVVTGTGIPVSLEFGCRGHCELSRIEAAMPTPMANMLTTWMAMAGLTLCLTVFGCLK